jgi:signal transduction histidine kinase
MMHEFLSRNRLDLIERCRAKVAERKTPQESGEELAYGIPLFLDQVIKTLEMEQTSQPMSSRSVSGPSGGGKPITSEIGDSAAQHGRELSASGFTVDQVVHDYGDACQAITDLAFERSEPIAIDEFRTLNRCLDNAIADAATEFIYQHDLIVADRHSDALNERLGFFAHELRNLLNTATLAVTALKAGRVGFGGATAGVLDASLVGLRDLIDRSLTEVRMAAGMPIQRRLFSIAHFIEEVALSATLEAGVEQCKFVVAPIDPRLAVDADRQLLFSAVGNLLQNAFKFTHHHSEVSLKAYGAADRIRIDVEDQCGGLQPGDAETMFEPFTQKGRNLAGLGLGLSIARRSVEANGGILSVRNKPGVGCIFTIDLPRFVVPESSSSSRWGGS